MGMSRFRAQYSQGTKPVDINLGLLTGQKAMKPKQSRPHLSPRVRGRPPTLWIIAFRRLQARAEQFSKLVLVAGRG